MRVGVIPDMHFPAAHPGALAFLRDTFDAWDVQQVVDIGDVSDLHQASFHDKNPNMPGPKEEFFQAKAGIQKMDRMLHRMGLVSPKNPLLVCEGNHDDRPKRIADKFGISAEFLKSNNTLWETPDWRWALEHVIDDVLYTHGHKGCGGGKNPALLTLEKGLDLPIVIGHYHTRGGITPLAGRRTLRWGMNVGCLVDRLHPAMRYSEVASQKQVMSCGVVIDGHPYYEMMPCGPGERYNRRRFKTRKAA